METPTGFPPLFLLNEVHFSTCVLELFCQTPSRVPQKR